MAKTSIQWTDFSWNPLRARNLKTGNIGWYCTHASQGCANCYAETFNMRLGTGLPFKPGHRDEVELYLDKKTMTAPLRWTRPRKIFVCSMSDLFGDFVSDADIGAVFAVMALCPQHTFQVLTKRSERMRDLVPQILSAPLPNVWLGVSCEDQETADQRIPHLLDTPAAVRFISAEPLLGPIRLRETLSDDWLASGKSGERKGLSWCIIGGESGPKARPMHPDWARSLRDQCQTAGVAFFYKQTGEHSVVYDRDVCDPDWRRCDIVKNETPRGQWLNLAGGQGFHGERVVRVDRVGKAKAGRLLDGIEHNAFPPS